MVYQQKAKYGNPQNAYVFTMVSCEPRQLVGFDVSMEKSAKYIQGIAYRAPDTFTVEGVNADLRHYIPILARRSRCFPRSLETLRAVFALFAYAYNRFHLAVFNFRLHFPNREFPLGLVDFL